MSLLREREIAREVLVNSVNNLLETPLFFGVGKFNGLFHGNKISMNGSKFFKIRKKAVIEAVIKFKKIEKLCFLTDILSKINKTKIEDIIKECRVYGYGYETIRPYGKQAIEELSQEVKDGFNED